VSLPAEVEAAVGAEGMAGAEVELISPLGERKGRRLAYRVRSKDRTVKLRVLDSSAVAEELESLSRGLDAAFVPVIARHGRVTVEPWVEGTLLDGDSSNEVERAARVLGRLHAGTARPAPSAAESQWLAAAHGDLRILEEADLIDAETATTLRWQLVGLADRPASSCVIHRDFCLENLIVDREGELRVIDNEWLAVGPPAYDLGRTLHRWPLDDEAWAGFLTAYVEVAGEPQDRELWMLVAALMGARVAHQRAPEQLERALAMTGTAAS
jgi:Ser/Thr protein kinase RdoA (MazF antagonist)